MTGKQFVIAETTRQSKGKRLSYLDCLSKYADFAENTKQTDRKIADYENIQNMANRIGLNTLEFFEVSTIEYPKKRNQKRLRSGAKIIFKSSVIKW